MIKIIINDQLVEEFCNGLSREFYDNHKEELEMLATAIMFVAQDSFEGDLHD